MHGYFVESASFERVGETPSRLPRAFALSPWRRQANGTHFHWAGASTKSSSLQAYPPGLLRSFSLFKRVPESHARSWRVLSAAPPGDFVSFRQIHAPTPVSAGVRAGLIPPGVPFGWHLFPSFKHRGGQNRSLRSFAKGAARKGWVSRERVGPDEIYECTRER